MLFRFIAVLVLMTSALHAADNWTNENLKELVSTGKKGIIYTWSPRHAYSVLELPRFLNLAKKMGYQFTAIVDPEASADEVEAALQFISKKNLTKSSQITNLRNVASEVTVNGDEERFPKMFVYSYKKIHPKWMSGTLSNNEFQITLESLKKELR